MLIITNFLGFSLKNYSFFLDGHDLPDYEKLKQERDKAKNKPAETLVLKPLNLS